MLNAVKCVILLTLWLPPLMDTGLFNDCTALVGLFMNRANASFLPRVPCRCSMSGASVLIKLLVLSGSFNFSHFAVLQTFVTVCMSRPHYVAVCVSVSI